MTPPQLDTSLPIGRASTHEERAMAKLHTSQSIADILLPVRMGNNYGNRGAICRAIVGSKG